MELTKEYVKSLKDKFYKLLCLFEERNTGLTQYIDSLNYEIYGLQYLVDKDKTQSVISLICILEHFYDDSLHPEVDLKVIRREIFHCMDLIEKTFGVGD
ncbi:hypothetical protein [Metabacillus sp. Hm71]|uniref:hypothetical protein n=1 Tax=Metabacillus sp. Hm71 TaxID=3450743 RepID=UPI003F41D477